MAAIIKLRHMPVMQRCLWNHLNKVSRNISTSKESDTANLNKVTRNISTSKKDSDSATATACESQSENNWVSYGFDYKSEKEDKNAHHASFFFSVTLCLVFGTFMWAYAPDVHMRDWAQREAFLVLRHREKANAPVISPFYVDPSTIKLPDEGDICEMEVLI